MFLDWLILTLIITFTAGILIGVLSTTNIKEISIRIIVIFAIALSIGVIYSTYSFGSL